uniref:Uncharacterized protein n=1 Tax=Myoviridae sp. ctakU3 TaxID=2825135 RepID=A0A8S5P0N1_9CAUD|nr:MAG TPA: hypothetical protein [Myoviridae sp. ctakU3]
MLWVALHCCLSVLGCASLMSKEGANNMEGDPVYLRQQK